MAPSHGTSLVVGGRLGAVNGRWCDDADGRNPLEERSCRIRMPLTSVSELPIFSAKKTMLLEVEDSYLSVDGLP
jgi:hypothetical protein